MSQTNSLRSNTYHNNWIYYLDLICISKLGSYVCFIIIKSLFKHTSSGRFFLSVGTLMHVMFKLVLWCSNGAIKTLNCLKRRERSDSYLTHVCRLSQSVESLKRIDKKTSTADEFPQCWLKAPVFFLSIISRLYAPWLQTSQVGVTPFSPF